MRSTKHKPEPTRRTLALIAGLAAVAPALLATLANAQHLNLGPSTDAPKPGEGLAALALADLLDAEAKGRDDADPRRAFRALAAQLLRDGERAGAPGSDAVLTGLTLASKRDELDALLGAQDPPTRRYIADLLHSAPHSIDPRQTDLLLRDALAPLNADADPRCGWWDRPDAEAATEDALQTRLNRLKPLLDVSALTDEAEASIRSFLELAETSRDEPAYRRAAIGWADLILGAGAIFDDPPAWLDMPARDRIRDQFCGALAGMTADPDSARRTLTINTRILRIVTATDSLPDDRQSRELRDAVNSLAAAPDGDPRSRPDAVQRIADTYARALDLIAAPTRLPAPDKLVRQTRPMLDPLQAAHRLAADAMVKLLPKILAEPDPMTDPAVLASMGSLASAAADLDIAPDLSGVLSGWNENPTRPSPAPSREPAATSLMGPLAERVRRLGVALGRADEAGDALTQLRELHDLAVIAPALPGETEMRANTGSPAWRHVTGDQASRLLSLTDEARKAWLQSVATDQFADRRAGDEARLRTLAAVLPLLRDAAEAEQLASDWSRKIPPAANRLPGWELTRDGLDALGAGMPQRAARLAAVTARGDSDTDALAAAREFRSDFAAVLLCGRVEREAEALSPPGCDLPAELGSGPADEHAWRADERETLASICRAAYEAGAADGQPRGRCIAYANRLATYVRDPEPHNLRYIDPAGH